MLRIQEPARNLGITREIGRGDLAVDSAMTLDDGDVAVGDDVVDSGVEGGRDASCAGAGNLFH